MVSETAEHIDSPGREDPSGEVAVYGIFRDGAVRVAWRHSFNEFITANLEKPSTSLGDFNISSYSHDAFFSLSWLIPKFF
jgi:hypothetical protein